LVCRQKEPLIRAAFGTLIGADPPNEVSANQRLLLSGKVVHIKLNHYQLFIVDCPTNILLVFLAAFLATAFVFELLRGQYGGARPRAQLVLFNRYLVSLLLLHSG
jgi:hypothetical protein